MFSNYDFELLYIGYEQSIHLRCFAALWDLLRFTHKKIGRVVIFAKELHYHPWQLCYALRHDLQPASPRCLWLSSSFPLPWPSPSPSLLPTRAATSSAPKPSNTLLALQIVFFNSWQIIQTIWEDSKLLNVLLTRPPQAGSGVLLWARVRGQVHHHLRAAVQHQAGAAVQHRQREAVQHRQRAEMQHCQRAEMQHCAGAPVQHRWFSSYIKPLNPTLLASNLRWWKLVCKPYKGSSLSSDIDTLLTVQLTVSTLV